MSTQSQYQAPLAARAFVLHYRPGRDNCCPGCGHSNWFVGRLLAECAMCTTVLPLRDSQYAVTHRLDESIALAA